LIYVIDTSALVDAWSKWYSPRSHPSFWEYLDELAQSNRATIPDAVLFELQEIDDGLFRWVKEREEYICTLSSTPIQEIVKYISNTYPNLRSAGTPSKNFADPIVIAMAKYFNCAVVTHEQATGNLNGPKMPDVCKQERIRVMQFHHLVMQQGWTFR